MATERLLASHPAHIPVIVNSANKGDAPMRFLVPREGTVGSILKNIRSKLNIASTESIFLYVDKFLLPVHQSVDEIYARHHDKSDLRLYVRYAQENTFGSNCK